MTNIFQLIMTRQVDAVKSLIHRDPTTIHQKDPTGFTPLIFSTYMDSQPIAEALIAAGAEVDQRGSAGYTALMGVCFKGNLPLARLLLDKGADPSLKNDEGMTALDFAKKYNQPAIVKLLTGNESSKTV